MNQPCIKLRISILVLLFPFVAFSQGTSFDTAGFYKHLVNEGLYPEQIAFARQIQRAHVKDIRLQDSLELSISSAYAQLGRTDSANANLLKVSAAPALSTRSTNMYLSLLITGGDYAQADRFIKAHNSSSMPVYFKEASTSIKMLEQQPTKDDTNTTGYSSTIKDIKARYENPPHHSAFLAGAYSAIIPGLGKLYLGYRQQAISAFIENVALGAQATESYIKAGPLSARFIITGALFGLFYGGNIWGSAILAKKQKVDHKKQLEYEIYRYYNNRVNSCTY